MASFTQQMDNLFAHTMRKRVKGVEDQIFQKSPTQAWLRKKGRVLDGGTHIEKVSEIERNSSIQSITEGGSVSIVDVEPDVVLRYDWAHVTGHIKRSLIRERKNRGTSKLLDDVQRKIDNLTKSYARQLEIYMYAETADGSGNPLGLQRLVAIDPTASYTLGGYDQSTAANSWWRNQTTTSVGAFATNGITEMRSMKSLIAENMGDVDGIFTTRSVYDAYKAEADDLLYIEPGGKLDFGFEAVSFEGVPLTQSPHCTSGYMYMLDSDALSVEKLGSGDAMLSAEGQEWLQPTNQPDTRIKHWLAHLQFCIWNRRKSGVLSGITV